MNPTKRHLFLSILLWSIFPHFCNAQKYVIQESLDTRKVFYLKNNFFGIKCNASGGFIEVRMFSVVEADRAFFGMKSYSTGGRSDPSLIYGFYLDDDSGNEYARIGWYLDDYKYPWYCLYGFCADYNPATSTDIYSTNLRRCKSALYKAASYPYIEQLDPISGTPELKEAILSKMNVVIELEITGSIDPCSIKGIKLPGINLCVEDFIPNLSSQCNLDCDFKNNLNRMSSSPSVTEEKNPTILSSISMPPYLSYNNKNNELVIYPNPSDGKFKLDFYLKEANLVSFKILDINKKLVFEEKNKPFEKGSNSFSFNLANKPPPGLYFVKVDSNEFSDTLKIIITST